MFIAITFSEFLLIFFFWESKVKRNRLKCVIYRLFVSIENYWVRKGRRVSAYKLKSVCALSFPFLNTIITTTHESIMMILYIDLNALLIHKGVLFFSVCEHAHWKFLWMKFRSLIECMKYTWEISAFSLIFFFFFFSQSYRLCSKDAVKWKEKKIIFKSRRDLIDLRR